MNTVKMISLPIDEYQKLDKWRDKAMKLLADLEKAAEKLSVAKEALKESIDLAEDVIGQHGFYEDGKPSYFNEKWGWSECLAKVKEALQKLGETGETK